MDAAFTGRFSSSRGGAPGKDKRLKNRPLSFRGHAYLIVPWPRNYFWKRVYGHGLLRCV